jgi:hypothetical protein
MKSAPLLADMQRILNNQRVCYTSGASQDDEVCKLYINNAEENGTTPQYLTLSYCWGKKEFMCLTKTTIETFLENIDIAILPTTIRDAIHISRRLGYSYIWIDALCIIQDSKEDWATESTKMGSIYRNSQLTIAALGAADSYQGCFVKRNPLCFRDIHLPTTDFFITSRVDRAAPTFKREFEVLGPAASPLQNRAWVVQEQASSPRTLYFGSSGMSWQCLECEADEAYPPGTKINKSTKSESPNLKRLLHASLLSKEFHFAKTWKSILGRYTSCKLTFPSDKLVAISGIAKLLAKASDQEYLAGLWAEDLCHWLLWSSKPSKWVENCFLHRLENDCPTFSWSSVGHATHYNTIWGADVTLEATSLVVASSGNRHN